jgi:sugar/nucleoside kinase (ribokinase family)
MAKIACVGHTTLDIIFLLEQGHLHSYKDEAQGELCLPFPSKVSAKSKTISLGGNAPNAGAGLKITGHDVVLVSQLGVDKVGEIIRSELEKWEFDLNYVTTEAESDTSMILSFQGDRTIVAYHSFTPYQFPSNLSEVDWVYLSSLGFGDFTPVHKDILAYLRANPKASLVYNPGRSEIDAGFAAINQMIADVHTLILNMEEAVEILGLKVNESMSDIELIRLLFNEFVKREVHRTIITDGKNGIYLSDEEHVYYHVPTIPKVPVDTTGAGDAFSAAYLSGLAHHRPFPEAVKMGIAQSANSVTQPGATNGLLTLAQLDEILKGNPVEISKI